MVYINKFNYNLNLSTYSVVLIKIKLLLYFNKKLKYYK